MKLKDKSLLILAILIIFIGAVSAQDENDTVAIENTDLSVSDTLETISVNDNVENTSIENNFGVVETNNLENESGDVSSVATTTVTVKTFQGIQDVITSASAGDTIRLTGTYTGSGTPITVNKNLNFIGVNSATLDAKTLSRIISISGGAVTFINITFKNGKLEDTSGTANYGGAVIISSGSGNFTNCNFIDNIARMGGAGYIYNSGSGNFTNCNFTENTASSMGGALILGGKSNCLTNCNFIGNIANANGGAVSVSSSSSTYVTGCNFKDNTITNGGGILYTGSTASYYVTGCNFTDNNVPSGGATMYISGACSFYVSNCIFKDYVTDKTNSVIYLNHVNSKLSLYANSIVTGSTPIYLNAGVVVSSTHLVVLNNQTVISTPNTPVTLTASLFDDNGNIIGSNTGIALNVVGLRSGLTASFNNDNLNYSITYTPTVGGVYVVTGTVPTSVANNVTEYKNGTLITGITTLNVNLIANNTHPVLNDLIKYTITIKNTGAYNVNSVTVEDILDTSKLEYVSCSPSGVYNSTNGIWLLENLASNQESSLNITVRIKSIGQIKNSVTVKSQQITNDITKNLIIVASKKITDMEVELLNTTPDNVTVKVTVPTDVTGNITIDINGNVQTKAIVDGVVVMEFLNINPGKYTMNITYSGDDNYESLSEQINITVKKDLNPSDIQTEILNNTYGNTAVKVTVPSTDISGNITINVNNRTYNGTLVDGSTIIKLADIPVGNYTMNVTYDGNEFYSSVSKDVDLEVIKADLNTSNMIVDVLNNTYGNTTIKVTVPSDATGNITIKVNNKIYNGTIENGSAIIKLADVPAGNHTMNVTYSGDGNYNPLSKDLDLEVVKGDLNSSDIKTEILNNTYGNTFVKVTVPGNETGKAIININGENYTGIVDNGFAVINLCDFNAGNYTMNVTFVGDNYNPISKQEELEIIKANITNLDTTIINNTVNNVIIQIIIPDNVTGNITINVDNKTFNKTLVNSEVVFEISDIFIGNYNMTINYSGNDNYNPFTAEELLKVRLNLKPEQVTVNILNNTYGNTTVQVTVPYNVTGNVTIKVGNKNYTANITGGVAVIEMFDLPVGNYSMNMDIIYNGDDNYNPLTKHEDLEVIKANSSLDAEILNNTYSNTTIKVNVPKDATGNVTIKINDELYNGTIENGSAIVKLENVNVGNYTMAISYPGDNNYNPSSLEKELEVVKCDINANDMAVDVINNTYGNTTVKITLPNDASGNITVTVGGKNYTGNISNGSAIIKLPDVPVGNHTMTITYPGDDNYNPIAKDENLEVVKSTLNNSDVKAEILNNTYGNTTVKITVPENATGNITIKVGNQTYNGTIENGSVIIKLPDVPVGNHTMNITYSGDDNYNPIAKEEQLEIVKSNLNSSDMIVDVLNNTYGNTTIKVTLPNDATGNVTIKVNGNEYKGNISNGSAIIKLKDVPVGNHTMNVTYNGDNNYNPIAKEEQLEVVKSKLNPSDVKVEIINDTAGNVTIKVTVPGNETGNVTIKIGDKIYNGTVENGSAIIKIPDINSGNYTGNVTFEGDNYEPISQDIQLEINKAKINLPVEAIDITYGETEKVTVWLPEDATGYIVFDVNGTKHTVYINPIFATAIGDKQYSSTFNGLNVGEYTATVTYSGDDKYESITNSTSFKVIKSNLSDDLKVEIINDTVGNVTLNITVPGDATGNITIKIGNETYNGTIENGSAIVKLPDTPVGNHTIEIIYPGDDNYNPINETMNITVDKINLNPDDIKTEVLNNTYGNVTIKVSVPENATGNITVTINNQTYTGVIDNGSAIIKLENAIAGNNTAIITYSGDENYNPVTKEEIIEVVKKHLNPDDINVTIGNNTYGNVTVNVTVPGDATGNITITIGNETYIAPIVNGSAIIELPDVPAGDHNMTIKYPGDDNYEEITIDKNLTIAKNTLNPDDIKVTIENNTEGNVVIKVTAPEGVTGNITLVIEGKQYTMELVNGTATFIITDIPAGIYNIQVIYSGDNYEGFTKNLTLEIIAKSTNSQTTSNTIYNTENVDDSNITNGISNSDSLENIKTANPIALLLLILLAIPLRRKEE